MSNQKRRPYVAEDEKILAEWDWEANNASHFDPFQLTQGSTKEVFWICEKGHHWPARIDHRFVMKSGCPYCSGKKPIVGENDLATTHPHLLKDWVYEKNDVLPQEVKAGCNSKVWWHCSECGRDYPARISHRALRNTGCRYCAPVKRGAKRVQDLVKIKGSLAETNPKLCLEWHTEKNSPLIPEQVTAGSNKRVEWRCLTCGYEWKKSVAKRHNGEGCPVCAGKIVLPGYNDLATTHPHLAAEWHWEKNGNVTPQQVMAGSGTFVWWQCAKCHHEWPSRVYSRKKTGCPVCAGRVVVAGFNDLATTHPSVAQEWHPTKNGTWTAEQVVAGCNKKVWWQCSICHHEWPATVNSRASGCGCNECAKKKRVEEKQKTLLKTVPPLSESHSQLAKEWDYEKNGELSPDTITKGSKEPVWWKCSLGHSWPATVNSRVHGRGCRICAGETQTSFPEQVLYFYFSQVTLAENRKKLFGKELDIYLPNCLVGIEYNGRFYHRDRQKNDDDKIRYFADRGVRVFSVKEGCEEKREGDRITYSYSSRRECNYSAWQGIIEYICGLIALPTPNIDVGRDSTKIFEQYKASKKVNSLAEKHPEIAAQWHPVLNGSSNA